MAKIDLGAVAWWIRQLQEECCNWTKTVIQLLLHWEVSAEAALEVTQAIALC